jgi:glycosyltransferase involved in cell wall biosynthesis
MKTLSILIVTKNRSALLIQCLESLYRLSERFFEIIIVDNGSTDTTKIICTKYARQLPIHYWYTTVRGYPKIYNFAIHKSKGDWIIFLDDDCIVSSSWLKAILQAIQKYPNAIIQGKTISMPKNNIYAQIMGDHYQNWIKANLLSGNRLRTFDNKNLCVPRSVINRYGMFDERLVTGAEDIELGFRYARHGVVILYDSSIVAYHHERDTLSGFLQQHLRIAKGEARLDSLLPKEYIITAVNKKKTLYNLSGALKRECRYLLSGNFIYAMMLPCLYIALAVIRLWGYYMTAWRLRK